MLGKLLKRHQPTFFGWIANLQGKCVFSLLPVLKSKWVGGPDCSKDFTDPFWRGCQPTRLKFAPRLRFYCSPNLLSVSHSLVPHSSKHSVCRYFSKDFLQLFAEYFIHSLYSLVQSVYCAPSSKFGLFTTLTILSVHFAMFKVLFVCL